ncbi:hypothetical protein TEA_030199 [Camellia sinensis var. sinensis]|uniref:Uncharacterized protein n=1 Tax=Camellia sinensis var. sinensis TaxID=542762 RepID=A0A4S4E766_CAMSN|nr:hypothetical protein TEA_030199 [Camellia sinensis var. sinensis]
MAKFLVFDEARKEFVNLCCAFDEVNSTLQTKFSQLQRSKMGEEDHWGLPPTGAPSYSERDDHWRHFDNSVNAISFGFVATAILISMFLVMAIFERFLRPNSPASSPSGRRYNGDFESQMGFNAKLHFPSPKTSNPLANAFRSPEETMNPEL